MNHIKTFNENEGSQLLDFFQEIMDVYDVELKFVDESPSNYPMICIRINNIKFDVHRQISNLNGYDIYDFSTIDDETIKYFLKCFLNREMKYGYSYNRDAFFQIRSSPFIKRIEEMTPFEFYDAFFVYLEIGRKINISLTFRHERYNPLKMNKY